jgi:hypothetical protein
MRYLLIVAALAGCATVPPEATAEAQVALEAQAEALSNARENAAAALDFWAGQLREAKRAHVSTLFEARVRAESQPTADWVLAEVAARDAKLDAMIAEIDAKAAQLRDVNLEVSAELGAAALDYVNEVSEREKKIAKLRGLLKIGAKK